MPSFSFWSIFRIFGVVSAWSEKALADGIITISEAAELAQDLGEILGIPTEVDLGFPAQPPGDPAETPVGERPHVNNGKDVAASDKTPHKPVIT